MSEFNLNLSSIQYNKLKDALKSLGDKELDDSKFIGNANSIFESLNNDNLFDDTGMQDILMSIAGEDENISKDELKILMQSDGNNSLNIEDFEEYALNAVNESPDNEKKVIDTKPVTKVKTIEKNGKKYEITYNDNGTIQSQQTKFNDGTSAYSEFIYDKNGNKTGAVTKKYDEKGNLQSTTETKYDNEGRKIYGKTLDGNGELVGEGKYEYKENPDGTISQLRYNKSGELTQTVVYKDNIKTPLSKTNNLNNSVEIYENKADGTMTSIVTSADGKKEEENSYDKNGHVLFKIQYNKYGEKIAEIKYTYYDNGELKNKEITEFKSARIEESKAVSNNKTEEIQTLKPEENSTIKNSNKSGQEIVNSAKKYLGYNETDGSYKKFGYSGHWCAAFVSYVMAENGIDTGGQIAVAGLRDWGISNGKFIPRDKVSTENVKPGDIVIWKDATHSHTGIVTSVNSDGSFDTIEGNTWGNGNRTDRVMEKHYNSLKNATGFISI